jgi:putative tricarboxylic transport membrane protein
MRAGVIESLVVLTVAGIGLRDAWRLSGALRAGGTFHSAMGPDTYLAVVSGGLLLCGVRSLIRTTPDKGPTRAGGEAESSGGFGQVARVVLVLIAYVAAFPVLGYLLATLIFFPIAFFLFGVRPWTKSLIIGAVVTAVFYVLFAYFAELPLPKGLLDFGP